MPRQVLLILLVVISFGIALPWMKGFDFLDPLLLLGYACTGVLFAAPMAATSATDSLPRIGAVAAYSWGISLLLLISGITTVNLQSWQGRAVLPSAKLIGSVTFLGAAACLAVSLLGSILARRTSPRTAITALRLVFLALLLGLAFGYRYMPEDVRFRIDLSLTTSGLIRIALTTAVILLAMALGLATLLKWPHRSMKEANE